MLKRSNSMTAKVGIGDYVDVFAFEILGELVHIESAPWLPLLQ